MAEFKPFEMIARIEYGGATYDGDCAHVCLKPTFIQPLVRCKDCKYFIENTWECVRLSDRFGDEYSDARVYPEYYCADGKRRTDGK